LKKFFRYDTFWQTAYFTFDSTKTIDAMNTSKKRFVQSLSIRKIIFDPMEGVMLYADARMFDKTEQDILVHTDLQEFGELLRLSGDYLAENVAAMLGEHLMGDNKNLPWELDMENVFQSRLYTFDVSMLVSPAITLVTSYGETSVRNISDRDELFVLEKLIRVDLPFQLRDLRNLPDKELQEKVMQALFRFSAFRSLVSQYHIDEQEARHATGLNDTALWNLFCYTVQALRNQPRHIQLHPVTKLAS
jgi:hypothetical protein